MTKVIVLGQSEPKEKELKKIEFVKIVSGRKDLGAIEQTKDKPSAFLNIELISKSTTQSYYDIMFAYDDDRSVGCIYLGHFNDGVV